MRKAIIIGKLDDEAKGIASSLSNQFQVQLCSEEQETIGGMLRGQNPDLIIVLLSGSAIAAREMFAFLLPAGIPIIGIGDSKQEAELVINGYLSGDSVRFLRKPASIGDILGCISQLPLKESRQETKDAVILMVDDSTVFLRAMQAMLSKKYKVIFATSGIQAIDMIAKKRPDLILLDYEMPVCDGKMTLERIRSDQGMKDIPVVFLTGISDAKHVSDIVALRPQGYLLKPCLEDMVLSTIEQALKKAGNKKI